MSGNLKIEKPSGGVRTEWVAGNDEHISWGINSDDQSYGLYDWKRGKWILQFKQDGQLYIAASIMNGILGLSNGQQARGYKQVVGGTDLSTEQSGFFSNGYCNYSKYVVAGDGGDKIAIGYEYGYDNPGFNFKVYNSGKLEKDAKILYLETSKLEPTTANGWTIGGNDLIIASDGVYLVSVTNSSSSDRRIKTMNKPLTIEQLKSLEVGEWVWIENILGTKLVVDFRNGYYRKGLQDNTPELLEVEML